MIGNRPLLLNYLPDIIIQYLIDAQSRKIMLPEKQSFKALLMYTNIPQFSQIAANYTRNSAGGLENLSNFLNKFLEVFNETVARTEGEILKFLNDKLIVIWPPFNESTEEEVTNICRIAVQSALQLQRGLFEKFTSEAFKPKISISFGLGEVSILHVGGVQSRVEYLIAGDALFQAIECDNMTQNGNDIVVNSFVLERVKDIFMFEQIKTHQDSLKSRGGNFFVIKSILKGAVPKISADPTAYKNSINKSTVELIRPQIEGYVQREFINFINTEQELWGCEYRRCTIVHIHIGVNILDLDKELAISKVHQIVRSIQALTFEFDGSLYRTITDQKGLTAILVFGLYPKAHQEDAARAVYSIFAIRKEIRKLGFALSGGLSSGVVFSTFLGFERRDIAILGDSVHMSYLLMLAAIKEKEKKILMSESTKISSEDKVAFKPFSNVSYKGRLAEENLFEPVEFAEEFPATPVNFNRFPELQTHYHNVPYVSNVTVETFQESKYMIGREMHLVRCRELAEEFLKNPNQATIVLVAGAFGIGKSLFARNFMDLVVETINSSRSQGPRPMVLSSSITPQNRDQKLNGWAKIMRLLLKILADKRSTTKEELLIRMLESTPDLAGTLPLMKNILKLALGESSHPEGLQWTQQLDSTAQKNIIRILMIILQEFLGEKDPLVDRINFKKGGAEEFSGNSGPPLILCLDDMQLHDEISWNLINRVAIQLKKVFIIGMIRIDEFDTSQTQTRMVEEAILNLGTQGQNVHKILLEKLSTVEISLFSRNFFGCRFSNESLNRFLQEKGEGNPALMYSLLQNLARQGLVTGNNDEIIISEKMRMFLQLGDFAEIRVPDIRSRANGARLDKIDLPQYLLLKLASIIGNKFDLRMLVVINPFKGSVITNATVVKALQSLKNSGLIEILNERDDKNVLYRFVIPNFREVVYQRLPLSIRKQLHRMVAEAFQNTSSRFSVGRSQLNDRVDSQSTEKFNYHWKIADPRGEEPEALRNPLKRATILEGGTSQIRNHDQLALLKVGLLEKKAVRTPSKWISRFVTLGLQVLKWYLNESVFRSASDGQAGMVYLQHIYSVRLFQDSDEERRIGKVGVALEVGKWYKGFGEMGSREIFLACKNQQDAENWYIFLEYARAKAIYDDFLNNFEVVSPVKSKAPAHFQPLPQNKSEKSDMVDESLRNRVEQPFSILANLDSAPLSPKWSQKINQSQETAEYLVLKSNTEKTKIAQGPDGKESKTKEEVIFELNESSSNQSKLLTSSQKKVKSTQQKLQEKKVLEEFLKKSELNFWSHLMSVPVTRMTSTGLLSTHDSGQLLGKPKAFPQEKTPSFRIAETNEKSTKLGISQPQYTASSTSNQLQPIVTLKKIEPSENSLYTTKPSSYFKDNTLSTHTLPIQSFYNISDEAPTKDPIRKTDPRNFALSHSKPEVLEESRETVKKPSKASVSQLSMKTREKTHQPQRRILHEEQTETTKVSQPNIHRKYEMFNGFFSDKYFDNSKLLTKNNQINKAHMQHLVRSESRRKKRKNVVAQGDRMMPIQSTPDTFVVNHEEKDRRPAIQSTFPRSSTKLLDEQMNNNSTRIFNHGGQSFQPREWSKMPRVKEIDYEESWRPNLRGNKNWENNS